MEDVQQTSGAPEAVEHIVLTPYDMMKRVDLIKTLSNANFTLLDASSETEEELNDACTTLDALLACSHGSGQAEVDEDFRPVLEAVFSSSFVSGLFALRDAIRRVVLADQADMAAQDCSICTCADLLLSRMACILIQQPFCFKEAVLTLTSGMSGLRATSDTELQVISLALLFCCLDRPMPDQAVVDLYIYVSSADLEQLPSSSKIHLIVLCASIFDQSTKFSTRNTTKLLDLLIQLIHTDDLPLLSIFYDYASTVMPFLFAASSSFPDYADPVSDIIRHWLKNNYSIDSLSATGQGVTMCIDLLRANIAHITPIFEALIIRSRQPPTELGSWLAMLCELKMTCAAAKLHEIMMLHLAPLSAALLDEELTAGYFMKYLSLCSKEELVKFVDKLDLATFLSHVSVLMLTFSNDCHENPREMLACMQFLSSIALQGSSTVVEQIRSQEGFIRAFAQLIDVVLDAHPKSFPATKSAAMGFLCSLQLESLFREKMPLLIDYFLAADSPYRALCCSAFASLLAEESPHILILLTFELLDDALMVNTERSLSLALTSLINNLYEMDATSARFILSSPICQHALHTLLRNHSQSKAVSWFSAKLKPLLTNLKAPTLQTCDSPNLGPLNCEVNIITDGVDLTFYREIV